MNSRSQVTAAMAWIAIMALFTRGWIANAREFVSDAVGINYQSKLQNRLNSPVSTGFAEAAEKVGAERNLTVDEISRLLSQGFSLDDIQHNRYNVGAVNA